MSPVQNTDMPTANPSRKVIAATGGAGVGSVIAGLVNWGLDDYVFDPDVANSVPDPVSLAVLVLVPTVLALAGGYFTKRAPDEVGTAVIRRRN